MARRRSRKGDRVIARGDGRRRRIKEGRGKVPLVASLDPRASWGNVARRFSDGSQRELDFRVRLMPSNQAAVLPFALVVSRSWARCMLGSGKSDAAIFGSGLHREGGAKRGNAVIWTWRLGCETSDHGLRNGRN